MLVNWVNCVVTPERIVPGRLDSQMDNLSDKNADGSDSARLRRIAPWALILILFALVAIGGAFLWASNRSGSDSSQLAAVQPKAEPYPAPEVSDNTAKQAVATLQQTVKDLQAAQQSAANQISDLQRQLSAEQGERKLLSEQVGALAARVDRLLTPNAETTTPALHPATPTPQTAKKKRGSR